MLSNRDFVEKYDPEIRPLKAGGRTFKFYLPRTIDRFIDSEDPLKDFPLWAKVWPSSMVLADYMVSEPAGGDRKTLEIGAGIGIVGIAAFSFGHDIVMSESNANALEFARANAQINDCAELPIISLDWRQTGPSGRFDRIVGSEVVFRDDDILPLKNLFRSLLNPGGEIILSSEIRKPLIDLLRMMDGKYEIKVQTKVLRSGTEEMKIVFCKMTAPI